MLPDICKAMYLYVTYGKLWILYISLLDLLWSEQLLAIQILHLTLSLEMNLLLGIEVLC